MSEERSKEERDESESDGERGEGARILDLCVLVARHKLDRIPESLQQRRKGVIVFHIVHPAARAKKFAIGLNVGLEL